MSMSEQQTKELANLLNEQHALRSAEIERQSKEKSSDEKQQAPVK